MKILIFREVFLRNFFGKIIAGKFEINFYEDYYNFWVKIHKNLAEILRKRLTIVQNLLQEF